MIVSYVSPDKVWIGGVGKWSVSGNWIPDGVPGAGDDVVIVGSGDNALLDSATTINSLVVGGTATLTFTNWTTVLTVANDVTIHNGGSMTLPPAYIDGAMSNRVYLVCSNLTIDAGGKIDANAKGFAGGLAAGTAGYGPGKGSAGQSGAGHGGAGGQGGGPYDSLTLPILPGSGGGCTYYPDWPGGCGGGAVYIDASGTITVNGTIEASGSPQSDVGGRWSNGGGSGGAIYLHGRTLIGTKGTVLANGGYGGWKGVAEGGGGRIAVVVDAAAQSNAPRPQVTFSAMNFDGKSGERGTVYFSDASALPTIFASGGCRIFGASSSWSSTSLTVSNAYVSMDQLPVSLTLSGNLTIMGSSTGRLDIGTTGNLGFGTLTCDSLLVTNRGRMNVFSGLGTTIAGASNVGALVTVTHDIVIASNSWIQPCSHLTNGGSVLFRAGNVRIAAGGKFSADQKGFDGGAQGQDGYGTGKGGGTVAGGAGGGGYGGGGGLGHGGGAAGITYGDEMKPVDPGSGGGGGGWQFDDAGGFGGGLVRIEALKGTVQVDGLVTANGGPGKINATRVGGAGAGGGIYIRCKNFAGGSSSQTNLQANGAASPGYGWTWGGGGGGGRIAVWRVTDTFQGQVTTLGGISKGVAAYDGATGTAHFVQIAPSGTVLLLR